MLAQRLDMACLCNHQDETVKIPKQPIWMFVLGFFFILLGVKNPGIQVVSASRVYQFTSLFEQLCLTNTT